MTWEDMLLAAPTDQWVVEQIIAFDWYDGPLQGWCSLAQPPAEFVFECVDHQHNPNGLDARTFQIRELPTGSVANALAMLEPFLGSPRKPSWCPIWNFPSQVTQAEMEQYLHTVENNARKTNLLVTTVDMIRFTNCTRSREMIMATTPQ
jgi:hypothetical protein